MSELLLQVSAPGHIHTFAYVFTTTNSNEYHKFVDVIFRTLHFQRERVACINEEKKNGAIEFKWLDGTPLVSST